MVGRCYYGSQRDPWGDHVPSRTGTSCYVNTERVPGTRWFFFFFLFSFFFFFFLPTPLLPPYLPQPLPLSHPTHHFFFFFLNIFLVSFFFLRRSRVASRRNFSFMIRSRQVFLPLLPLPPSSSSSSLRFPSPNDQPSVRTITAVSTHTNMAPVRIDHLQSLPVCVCVCVCVCRERERETPLTWHPLIGRRGRANHGRRGLSPETERP